MIEGISTPTIEEIKERGISEKDVKNHIRRLETRISKYVARHLAGLVTKAEEKEWDIACAHHDNAIKVLHLIWANKKK
jgi:exonuclease I